MALVVVLIFLLVLTLIGLSAMKIAGLAERLARNDVDRHLAYQAAEAALRDAEHDLEGRHAHGGACADGVPGCRPSGERPIAGLGGAGLSSFAADCGHAQCARSEHAWFDPPVWRDTGLFDTKAAVFGAYTGAAPFPAVSSQPRYLMEGFRRSGSYVFRITSLGYGANPSTRVMLQSIYQMRE